MHFAFCTIKARFTKKRLTIFLVITLATLLPTLVLAGEYDDLKIQDVFNIVSGLSCWLLSIALLLVIIFAVVTGVKFMTAGANATQAGEARKAVLQVFIAAMVIIGSYVIIVSVATFFGADVSLIPFSCS